MGGWVDLARLVFTLNEMKIFGAGFGRTGTMSLKIALENEASAGKDPMGLAAAALYLSCVKNGEDKTQRDIAEAANVTEVTIRNRYKGLKDSINL